MMTVSIGKATGVNVAIVAALVLGVIAVLAELPDEYSLFKLQQKGAACSTIYCPWYCDRFLDSNNGCVYCGKCTKPYPYKCPSITCPNLPHFECTTRRGRDGCNVCKCVSRVGGARRPYGMSAALIESPPSQPSIQRQPQPQPKIPPRTPPGSKLNVDVETVPNVGGVVGVPPGRCSGPAPLCSSGCQVEMDARGCERCSCDARPVRPERLMTAGAGVIRPYLLSSTRIKTPARSSTCPEAADAPCPARPAPTVCWRERGADGCYGCRCNDDISVCREIKCNYPRCQHVIDEATGCATGCQCSPTATNIAHRNDV